ncbi:MAG: hypothetical protein ACOYNY_13190 [Caldilineaceae bacterium]
MRISVEGIGFASDKAKNEAQRERSALLAAELDAKRKLAEWLNGAEIEAITIVDQGTLTTDVIRQTVKAKVPPFVIVQQQYEQESGTASVILEAVVERNFLP